MVTDEMDKSRLTLIGNLILIVRLADQECGPTCCDEVRMSTMVAGTHAENAFRVRTTTRGKHT
jgi:hypothetical protein